MDFLGKLSPFSTLGFCTLNPVRELLIRHESFGARFRFPIASPYFLPGSVFVISVLVASVVMVKALVTEVLPTGEVIPSGCVAIFGTSFGSACEAHGTRYRAARLLTAPVFLLRTAVLILVRGLRGFLLGLPPGAPQRQAIWRMIKRCFFLCPPPRGCHCFRKSGNAARV